MLILGAKGFAKEVLEIFHQKDETENLHFYDDAPLDIPDFLYNQFKVLKNEEEAKEIFEKTSTEFVIGIGNPQLRYKLTEKFQNLRGTLTSSTSQFAEIGNFSVEIGDGSNILGGIRISNDVKIGIGAIIFPDVKIGDYSTIASGAVARNDIPKNSMAAGVPAKIKKSVES